MAENSKIEPPLAEYHEMVAYGWNCPACDKWNERLHLPGPLEECDECCVTTKMCPANSPSPESE